MATKSELISGMGVAMSLIQGLVAAVHEEGGTDEQIHELVTEQGKPKLKKIACIIVNAAKAVKDVLLRKLASVAVSAHKKFVADDEAIKAANIGWTGDTFNRVFKNKIEENVPAGNIAGHHLERTSLDAPIMAELGGYAEISIVHFFELLRRQSKGEAGQLLVNGYANVAYIRGTDNNVWAVDARWYSNDRFWSVLACSVAHPDPWRGGRQVLSCDS